MTTFENPLRWPDGWARTASSLRKDGTYHFRRQTAGGWSVFSAGKRLEGELQNIGAKQIVVTSDLLVKQDGSFYARQPRDVDAGVAVYFMRGKRQVVMARDAWTKPEHNLVSLALAVEGLRQLERHGGGTMLDRAFDGFAALPAPVAIDCWAILGLRPGSDRDAIAAAYRQKAKTAHVDAGGTHDAMAALNAARDEALRRAA